MFLKRERKLSMEKQKLMLTGGAVALLLATVVGSPYWTVSQIKSAAQHNDSKALAEYIDFPSVKDSLKSQINGMLVKEVAKKGQSDGLEALGAAMATAFVGPMIDAFVTPETLTLMMQGKSVKLGETPAQQQTDTTGTEDDSTTNVEMGYDSYSRFNIQVSDKAEPNKKVSFTLKREGLWSWKVATLTMPMPNENKEVEEVQPVVPPPQALEQSTEEFVDEGEADNLVPPGEAALEAAVAPSSAAGVAGATSEAKPSFDCAKAHSTNEQLICSDAELANLDAQLFVIYQQAKQLSNNADWFKQSARNAFKWRESNCHDKACLLTWYSDRKNALNQIIAKGGVE
jgi:uncharacterized protein YecT (DUF1311 family)